MRVIVNFCAITLTCSARPASTRSASSFQKWLEDRAADTDRNTCAREISMQQKRNDHDSLFRASMAHHESHSSDVISRVSADSSCSIANFSLATATAPRASNSFKKSPSPSLSTSSLPTERRGLSNETEGKRTTSTAGWDSTGRSTATLAPKSSIWASLRARSFVEYLKRVREGKPSHA